MKSFFEKLTGASDMDDEFNLEEVPENAKKLNIEHSKGKKGVADEEEDWIETEEGELTIDMYQTPNDVVIKTMVAGVKPDDLDISITRDMVTVRGKREEKHIISEEDYFSKELYWGSFSKTITLPAEIEVEEAEATEDHGLLTIKLPKIDKNKSTKLKVKSK